MRNRNYLVLGAIAAAAVVVVPLAFLIPGETGTRLVAALAFVVALGKVAYDVWEKEGERARRADEAREKVRAAAKYGYWDSTGEELGVLLYNESASVPVHIRAVVCHYRPADGQPEQSFGLVTLGRTTEEPLPPGHATKFRDGGFKGAVHKALAALPEGRVWISVTSHQGEVCRVGGKEIQAALRSPPTSQVDS